MVIIGTQDAVTDLQVVTLPFSERFSQDQDQPLELWTAATQGIQAQAGGEQGP